MSKGPYNFLKDILKKSLWYAVMAFQQSNKLLARAPILVCCTSCSAGKELIAKLPDIRHQTSVCNLVVGNKRVLPIYSRGLHWLRPSI